MKADYEILLNIHYALHCVSQYKLSDSDREILNRLGITEEDVKKTSVLKLYTLFEKKKQYYLF